MTRTILDRPSYLATLENLSKSPDILAALHGAPPVLPDSLAAWLAEKFNFEGIPFDYLVADDQLLPNESIRFFTVDANWQLAMADGACSIGRLGPLDTAIDQAFMFSPGGFVDQARASAGQTWPVISGFILRSQAVRGYWPGIRIEGYADTTANERLKAIRIECLAPSVLLVLFDGRLSRVDIHEPPEGMHFGLEGPDNLSAALLQRTLRYLANTGSHVAGDPMDANVLENRFTVQKDAADLRFVRGGGVIKASLLAGAFGDTLIARHALPASAPFTSAEFALEMIEGVDLVSYSVPSPPPNAAS